MPIYLIAFLLLFYVGKTIEASLLSTRFPKPEFTNKTKDAMKGFAPMQDLRWLNLCHVVPFGVIDNKLSSAFIPGIQNRLTPGGTVNESKILELRADIFGVDNEAAYIKQADMRTKMKFYLENANQRRQLDDAVTTLNSTRADSVYAETIRNIITLFYNAPANLRVSPTSCINDEIMNIYEDPNLKFYDGSSYRNLSNSEFTEQSKYLAKKYNLEVLRDHLGYVRTTDRKKILLNPTLSQSLNEINKGLNVFQFLRKKQYLTEEKIFKEENQEK